MDARAKTGRRGEDIVCTFLAEKGHVILDRNWRYGHLEIDIITMDGDGIHFVEVKSRNAPAMAAPEENVGRLKQKRIASAAAKYLATKQEGRFSGQEAWLDVAAVTFMGDTAHVDWFPNAYIPIFT